jgi:hypothetical protein
MPPFAGGIFFLKGSIIFSLTAPGNFLALCLNIKFQNKH